MTASVAAAARSAGTTAKRRPERIDEILTAACELFHRVGFEKTAMSDIGAATGITGPAIYRHFASKRDILDLVLMQGAEMAHARLVGVREQQLSPSVLLEALIATHVDLGVSNPALAGVALRELHHAGPEAVAFVDRVTAEHFHCWVGALVAVRPELNEAEARVIVHGMLAACHEALRQPTGLDDDRLRELLMGMMRGALSGGSTRPRRSWRS